MKKLVILPILFILTSGLLSQTKENIDYNLTIKEINSEREISNWIENLLFPLVGKVIVVVDLKLKYPSIIPSGMELNDNLSLPSLPAVRSRQVIPSEIAGQVILPTEITKFFITIFVDKEMNSKQIEEIRKYLNKWFDIDPARGDGIKIEKVNHIFSTSETPKIGSNKYLFIALIIVLILAIFLISSNMNKAVSIISNQLAERESTLHKANFAFPSFSPMHIPGKEAINIREGTKPIPIRIVREKTNTMEKKRELTDFSFLNEMPEEELLQLISDEQPKTIALILSQLLPEKGVFILEKLFSKKYDSEKIEQLTKEMIDVAEKSKTQLISLRQKLLNKIIAFEDKQVIGKQGEQQLINFINNSQPSIAKKIADTIMSIRPNIWEKIKKNIFLVEDIVKLDDRIIEALLRNISRQTLVSFLSVSSKDIRNKFYKNMTPRAVSIIKEDIEIMREVSKEKAEESTYEVLQLIRMGLGLEA